MTVLNEKGFTLVEAMVIGAVLAVLVMTAAGYQYQRKLQINTIMRKKEYGQIQNAILSSAGQPEALVASEEAVYTGTNATDAPGTPITVTPVVPSTAPSGTISAPVPQACCPYTGLMLDANNCYSCMQPAPPITAPANLCDPNGPQC